MRARSDAHLVAGHERAVVTEPRRAIVARQAAGEVGRFRRAVHARDLHTEAVGRELQHRTRQQRSPERHRHRRHPGTARNCGVEQALGDDRRATEEVGADLVHEGEARLGVEAVLEHERPADALREVHLADTRAAGEWAHEERNQRLVCSHDAHEVVGRRRHRGA